MVSPGLLSNTPALIVICQHMVEMSKRGGDFGCKFLTIADSAMAAQNIMLAAHDLGLGTCVIASFHCQGVQQILQLPEEIVLMLLIFSRDSRETFESSEPQEGSDLVQ